jgi:plastocyanin
MSATKSSSAVGIVVAILIIGAVATIGYYQVEVAPNQVISSTTTTSSAQGVNCVTSPSSCVNVTIVSGASSPYSGYASGSTTLYGYLPLDVVVVIGVNNTVVWTNKDTAFHTATSASTDPASFDSSCLDGVGAPCPSSSGVSTYQFTFTVPGTYVYHCIYHPWMQGKIIVLAGTGASTTTSHTSTTSA